MGRTSEVVDASPLEETSPNGRDYGSAVRQGFKEEKDGKSGTSM